MSIVFLDSSHNHTIILSLFKTDYYYYYFISFHTDSVFCVFLFACLLFSVNRSNRKSCISECTSVVPQSIELAICARQPRSHEHITQTTVNSLYCRHPQDLELVSLMTKVLNGGNSFKSNVSNLFLPGI